MLKKKRHFLLLEVMIAFAIIALCIFPLIYPHAAIAKAQREFIKKIELDHVVTLLYAQIYQDLQRNRMDWSSLESQKSIEIKPEELKKLNNNKSLPFKGSYYFKLVKHKPKLINPNDSTAYLFDLIFEFHPEQYKKAKKNETKELADSLRYKYTVFILRELGKNHEEKK